MITAVTQSGSRASLLTAHRVPYCVTAHHGSASWNGNKLRFYSTEKPATIDYQGIQTLIKDKNAEYYLIDVREPNELLQGAIPTAKNIPLSQFMTAWSMSEEDFEDTFGYEKPSPNANIIVYCQAGIRSSRAASYLGELGYKGVQNYIGSWADYAEQSKSKA
ncbi:Rhodanese-like domain-containing protein [Radiomyces spectabilis]|uniref:Rhodanese-like domain-containing protein n=1 Tax=Radiomyces spectabilis TaxID=64574 RepID=UPI00221FAC27|nr:Rhodanese-like domain-containing protein [Radiomyces spectabilis]KAI8371640.1 Rhodanese-like domain-containing protein [Radiomyces spectabilis]